MNQKIADVLSKINTRFYQEYGASFAATRQAPWPGWQRCLELLRPVNPDGCKTLSVLDLACGNLRFAAFLQAALPDTAISFYAVDNCDALVGDAAPSNVPAPGDAAPMLSGTSAAPAPADAPSSLTTDLHYQHLDIAKLLKSSGQLNQRLEAPACDLSVSFGFLHHLPLPCQRQELLRSLVEQARVGGHVIVSLWQFLKNPDLMEKARATLPVALEQLGLDGSQLADNDFLLGWQDIPGAYRYCHSFSEAEIDQLAASVADKAELTARFVCDGRSNDLNSYLVFRVG